VIYEKYIQMKKYTFTRLFLIPIILTINELFFGNESFNFSELFMSFCFFFTLNWFFDKTVVEWSIKRGQNLTEKKKNKNS
jgi:hypothetical protein